ncbi:MAG: hypothetical protein AAFV77_01770, partial [Planctomycetota bacterium]
MIPPKADASDATPLGVPRVVSRGFYKLQHGLHTFGIDVEGLACADLGDVAPNPADVTDSLQRVTAFYQKVKSAGIR